MSFKELGLDSIDQIELEVMVEQKFNIVIIDYDMETIPDLSLTGFTSTSETERSPRGCIKTDE